MQNFTFLWLSYKKSNFCQIYTFISGDLMKLNTMLMIAAFSSTIHYTPDVKAIEVAYRSIKGEVFVVDIPQEATFECVINEITQRLHEEDEELLLRRELHSPEYLVDFMAMAVDPSGVSTKGLKRVYKQGLSSSDKKNIEHIVLTLGNSSLISLAKSKSELRKKGQEIDHIHPLRFLEYVFSNENLKAAFSNMEKRKWVWSEFFDGMKKRLDEEASNKNVTEHLDSFAKNLNINIKNLQSLVKEKRWKDFLNALFLELPRSGNSERYDM